MTRARIILTGLVLSALVASGGFAFYEAQHRSIVSVRVAGDLRFTSRTRLEESIAKRIDTSLYRVDVSAIRDEVLALAWVKDASVRRVWPDSLHVAVLERDPVARWTDGGLVEADGTLFYPDNAQSFSHLPLLDGPLGTSSRVLERLWQVRASLRPLGWEVNALKLNARRAWSLTLDNGIRLQLGQDINEVNLDKVVRAFQSTLARNLSDIEQVDLRYTNGFAVRWKRELHAQSGGGQG